MSVWKSVRLYCSNTQRLHKYSFPFSPVVVGYVIITIQSIKTFLRIRMPVSFHSSNNNKFRPQKTIRKRNTATNGISNHHFKMEKEGKTAVRRKWRHMATQLAFQPDKCSPPVPWCPPTTRHHGSVDLHIFQTMVCQFQLVLKSHSID